METSQISSVWLTSAHALRQRTTCDNPLSVRFHRRLAGVPVITWWGHATTTVQDSGVRVLTDPVFASRFAHLRRCRGPAPGAAAAAADLVVISHLHSDHLHLPSLAALRPDTPVLLPAGATASVRGLRRLRRLHLVEVAVGDQVTVGAVRVRAVSACHDGRRWPVGGKRVAALGYVITGSSTTYFAGDTDLFPEMPAEVGPCDLALLPVGGWGPRLGEGHLDPQRAAVALATLGARAAVPIHYGTFAPLGLASRLGTWFHRPGREFTARAAETAPAAAVHELCPGDTAAVAPESAPP